MKTAAIRSESTGMAMCGELIERIGDGTVTIRFARSLILRGAEVTVADMMQEARSLTRAAP